MKILVTGINGFIGSHLAEAILSGTDWEITGFDLCSDNIADELGNKNINFKRGDIFKDTDWLEEQVKRCDVVIPLAGIAKPVYYLKKPVWTFELDFEQNLKMVRMCAAYGKRLIFPSTSEVYGLSCDDELKENESPLITGPVDKMRWIYSCSKQMMDRMIFAYGQEQELNFSIFRPFNWVGPRLDTFRDAEERSARSVTQMIYDIIFRGEVTIVDGGVNRRSFTWIGDAIEGLLAIIADKEGNAGGEIFNIGNPDNNCSIKEFAKMLVDEMGLFPEFREKAEKAVIVDVPAASYYGRSYEDMKNRKPSVKKMEQLLGWKPRTDMRETLRLTLAWYARREREAR